jgi:putative ABC transport system permease protein
MPITDMGAEVPIARRNLLADKAKFFVALGGVTLAVVLILVVQSLYQGVKRDYASFIRSLPGEVWVAQKGITGLTFSNSFLTTQAAADVASIPGVRAVHRLHGRLTSFEVDGDETRMYVWAMAPGGSLAPEEERILPEPGTIFIDRSLAKQAGLSRGDTVRYGDAELTVAEVGQVGNVLVAQFAFINQKDYERLFGVPGAANYFLVSVSPEASGSVMDEIVRRVDDSSVFTRDEFVGVAEEAVHDFLPLLQVVTVLSLLVGLGLLCLTIYSATIERCREYGIMKALGASPWRLYRIVFSQSAIVALLGFSVGVGLAFLFNRVAEDVVPRFATYIRWQDVAFTLGVAGLMTFVASLLPINRVARIDPASVFRA